MKKTMFITSVIMVVVLAIALTTSSLAWFSAGGNTSVHVTEFTVQAKANVAANGLEISKAENTNYSADSISLYSNEEVAAGNKISRDGFIPMAPVGVLGNAATEGKKSADDLYNLLRGEMFQSQTKRIDVSGTLTEVMASAATRTSIPFFREFYIRNSGENSTANVNTNLTVELTNEMSYYARLCVAVFDVTGTVYTPRNGETAGSHTGNVKLLAFVGNNDLNAFCNPESEWALEAPVSTINGATTAINTLDIATLALEKAVDSNSDGVLEFTPHHIEVFAWFDGASLDNLNSDTSVDINIGFTLQ